MGVCRKFDGRFIFCGLATDIVEISWEFGIFTMMSVMVIMLGIVITSRFMYLDNRYGNIIRKFETLLSDLNSKDVSDSETPNIVSEERVLRHMQIAKYRTHRSENRNVGIKVDLFSTGMILILGFVTVFGVFENSLMILSVFLFVLFGMPLAYFIHHVRIVNRITSV